MFAQEREPRSLFGWLAFRDRGFKQLRLLLRQGNLSQAVSRIGERGIALAVDAHALPLAR